MSKSLRIAVDFDDTLARTDFPTILGTVSGAVEGMKALAAAGHRLFIWTCRHGQPLVEAKAWLDEQGIPYERINENCPAAIEQYGETRKLGADIYIDDKNLGGLKPWPEIVERVAMRVRELEHKEQLGIWEPLPRIIGISGKRGSGKDTIAKILDQLSPWGFFKQASFAGPLKEIAQKLTGHQDMFTQQGKTTFLPDWGMTAGEVLQKLGTDAIRNGLHENAWVLACFAGMKPDEHYIITDCRFPNEADAIRARGGVVIRIEGDPLKQHGDGTRNDKHPSECALDDAEFDYILHNDGSLDDLREKVQQLVAVLQQPAA